MSAAAALAAARDDAEPPAEPKATDDAAPTENRGDFSASADDDWKSMAAGLKQRSKEKKKKKIPIEDVDEEDDDVEEIWLDEPEGFTCGRQCLMYTLTFFLTVLLVGGWQFYKWLHPEPVSCSLELIRPQKFKVDVTEFFAPRVSAAIQLVLSVKNANMLRAMLLEQCKVTAYDDETGLKLGTAQQNSLVLQPFSTTQVTVTLNQLGGGLPVEEQRSLAATFLSKKALLLTIVATASSRLPKKGSIASAISNNASRRVEWPSSITKEPFFQRAHAPPAPEPEASPAGKPNKDEA